MATKLIHVETGKVVEVVYEVDLADMLESGKYRMADGSAPAPKAKPAPKAEPAPEVKAEPVVEAVAEAVAEEPAEEAPTKKPAPRRRAKPEA